MHNEILSKVVKKVEVLFKISVINCEKFQRQDQDKIINYFLTTNDEKQFFLKEIQGHSLRNDMDNIYRQFSQVQPSKFIFLLPMAYENNKFLFEAADKSFLLFSRENLVPFDPCRIEFPDFLSAICEMHYLIAPFTLPQQNFRTFSSWINRGLSKVEEKYGKEIPLIPLYKEFMINRFPQINFTKGNIHWDLHKDNVCFNSRGQLVILDLDLAQSDEYASDLARIACMYSTDQNQQFSLAPEVLSLTYQAINKIAPNITLQDIKFLICRTPLGPMQMPEYPLSKSQTISFLQSLERFISL